MGNVRKMGEIVQISVLGKRKGFENFAKIKDVSSIEEGKEVIELQTEYDEFQIQFKRTYSFFKKSE